MDAKGFLRNEKAEVLIVEDSPTQAEQLKHLLEKHEYKVNVAPNGARALAMLKEMMPTLIISDIIMPEMDGYTLCREIKADDTLKDIPVILMTQLSSLHDIIKGLECGADNFIIKPYEERYLLSRIQLFFTNQELRKKERTQMGVGIVFAGQKYFITAERQQILDLLLSTYETAVQKNTELIKAQDELREMNEQLEGKVQERTSALTAEIAVRKKAEEASQRVNRALKTLSECNQALVRADEESTLLKDICRIIVENGGYRMAWVGFAEQDEAKMVRPVEQAGYEEGYLETVNITWANDERGRGPTGTAVRTKKPSICKKMLTDHRFTPWRAEALKRGYASSIALPLLKNDEAFGALTIYATEPDAFDEEEVDLLTELADDLAYGIMSLRARTERNFMEEELRKVNKALKTLSECNQALIRATDEADLLQDICRVITEFGRYQSAWVGFAGPGEEKNVRPVAQAGYSKEYLEPLKITWSDTELGQGPAGKAIRTGNPYIVKDIKTAPDYLPWRSEALERGYRSLIALPLIADGQTFGALNIYAPAPDAFYEQEVAILSELANDLSYGIITLRSRVTMKKLSMAVEQSTDLIFITDKEGNIEYVNGASNEVTGYKKREVIGQNARIFKSGRHDEKFFREMWDTILSGRSFTGTFINRKKTGELFEVYQTITPLKDAYGNITHFVATSRDLTKQRLLEERINYLAFFDALTGLPNRTLLIDRLNQAIARAEYSRRFVGVLTISLDRLKLIYDTYGHEVGDAVLKQIGNRLSSSVREGDTVAYCGSNAFGISLSDVASPEDITRIVEKIIETIMSHAVKINEEEIVIKFSVGISLYPNDGKDAQTLLQNADIASSGAKERGENNYQFYAPDLNVKASEFVLLENHLIKALKNDEFLLHYQPYWEIDSKKIVGMEALIRWRSKGRGLVSPGEFITVLEETGMIIDVGRWVLKTAIRQVKEWQDKDYSVVPVSVNLSLIQFRQKGLAEMVKRVIGEFGFNPLLLTLEITESAIMQDIEFTDSVLKKLKEMGISISIDDFGTGYSSLYYLKRFPVDNLKIDISFIREITTDPDSASIVTAIVSMAHALGIRTIAEGVETEEQSKILHLLRCDSAQGYYFSKPLPPVEIKNLFGR